MHEYILLSSLTDRRSVGHIVPKAHLQLVSICKNYRVSSGLATTLTNCPLIFIYVAKFINFLIKDAASAPKSSASSSSSSSALHSRHLVLLLLLLPHTGRMINVSTRNLLAAFIEINSRRSAHNLYACFLLALINLVRNCHDLPLHKQRATPSNLSNTPYNPPPPNTHTPEHNTGLGRQPGR